MRKYIRLTILLLCLHIAARGQTVVSLEEIDLSGLPQPTQATALRYWFDDDGGSIRTVNELSGQHELDVSGLSEGLHTLHYQVIDNTNAMGYIRSGLFLKVNNRANITAATALRYWFDSDATSLQTISYGGVQTLDVSSLHDGLHTIHYQLTGTDGQFYYIASALFMKMGSNTGTETVTASKLMYWFDDETTIQSANITGGVQQLDVSTLADGLHTIHYQVLCSNGQMTATMSSLFLCMNANEQESVASKLRYWYDDDQTAVETAISDGVQMLDVTSLSEGLHTIHYQIVDSKGMLCAPASTLFLKMESQTAEAQVTSLRYWFDGDATTVTVTDIVNGTQTLDVSGLTMGLHTLCYQPVDAEGKLGTPVTGIFLKNFDMALAEGENRIVKYKYWLNRNSQEVQTVELSEVDNPYELVSLLLVQHEPIHSDCFHFEVTDGVPTVYAKNIFHVRFYDALDYFCDGDRPFIDYSVQQEVTDAELLQSGIRATTTKPATNTIKWYYLEAEPGDSVQFCLDRAATIQLFAPSGEEVFNASGSDVVKWGGCHAKESGTYYLALHDVTAQQGSTISIDYNHIDKYAVLRQDVALVGNGGCSTITFEGNGFRDLYAVDLFTEQGDSVHHVYIGHESDATTSVVFDFTDAALGTYHAKFRFAGEDKVFTNLVIVEEAKDIELATTVTYPSLFLRGTSTTYTVKITNKGNMTAYAVPISTLIKSHSKERIGKIEYEGLDLKDMFDYSNLDSLSEEEIRDIHSSIESMGDIIHFMCFHIKDEMTGDSVWIRSNIFYCDIIPNETKILRLVINSTEEVQVYFTLPKELAPLSSSEVQTPEKIRRRGPIEHLCCYHDRYECVLNVFTDIADLTSLISTILSMLPGAAPATVTVATASSIASCVSGILSHQVHNTALTFCDTDKSLLEKYLALLNMKSAVSVGAAIWNCMGLKLKKTIGLLKAILDVTADVSIWNYTTASDCLKAWTEKKPNCPPNSDHGGGTSIPVASFDPNEIYGYTAESGSKAVKDGLRDVYYTIQFENDTTFATASAHDIYVIDTLDTSKFDLSTFKPTRIKIGNKTAELTGEKNFVTTIDMRPEIYAIAQVEGTFNEQTGIARWHISSLDPMTMEPTDEVTAGVLPVNTDGHGIGEVMFDIALKQALTHGTEVPNRAGIVFDTNETIMTPTWKNIIDRIAPESHVTDVKMQNDSTASVSIEASDELSGPWRYDVYVQYGSGAWFLGAENVPIDKTASVKVYEGINHGFYTVVTDSAGNVEQKTAAREFTLEVFSPQVETNTKIQLAEGWNWMSQNQNTALSAEVVKPKAQRIMSQTEELYKDARFGWSGDLDELLPTQMYKVQMAESAEVQLSGLLFNAAFRSIPVRKGWNWIGYPVARIMTVAEALAKTEAEEGDALIGRDGLAAYSDGQWMGTLTEMQPGKGYMYRSVSDKNLFLNATAQASSRRANVSGFRFQVSCPDDWTVDMSRYPNVMGVVAELRKRGETVDPEEWLVAAFSDDECRGLAQAANGVLMMNVFGRSGEVITFRALHRESGEIVAICEQEAFRADLLGSMRQPYTLTMGELTGIVDIKPGKVSIDDASVFDLQGRKVNVNQKAKGVYIMTDGKKSRTQKVVRK